MVMNPSDLDENDLLASLSESARFGAIFERHILEIHRYLAYRVGSDLADDLSAETFLEAFRGRRSFDSSKGTVTAWLYGIATNLVRHHHRDEERRLRLSDRAARGESSSSTGEEFVDQVARQSDLDDAVARLDRKLRDVVLLVAGVGLTYAEAATAMGIPVGTVRSRFSRARCQMLRRLGTEPSHFAEGRNHGDYRPA
jgi:RNA polymerase sigma-70 factor (ECF subfamily)